MWIQSSVSFALSGAAVMYPFDLALNNTIPPEIDMRHMLLDPPAGKYGRVIADGENLVFENGKSARFWGVGFAFSGSLPPKFPPDHDMTDKIVERLASLGVNHVRFVGFDNNAPEPFRKWLQTGKITGTTIDRFDYFVSQLREAGIYYSLSIVNNAILMLDAHDQVDANNASHTKLRRYYNVKLFQDEAVATIAKWVKAFYSRKNKYTGLSIAEDPAHIYVATVNEDSMLDAYNDNYKHLSRLHKKLLGEKFERYIREKYKSDVELKLVWPGGLRNVRLLGRKDSKRHSARQVADVIIFLMGLDSAYYQTISGALREAGYAGLITGTNNWFGVHNLYVNSMIGDYIELHGYFDHPRYNQALGAESIGNYSYLSSFPFDKSAPQIDLFKEYSFPLTRSFSAAVEGKPLLFSEWNHSSWSDYAYEGPLVMVAYSSLQAYSALNLHTFFNHPNPDPQDAHSEYALTVFSNSVMNALMPSLGLAYLKGYIRESEDVRIINYPSQIESFANATVGLANHKLPRDVLVNGFCQKIRIRFGGEKSRKQMSKGDCALKQSGAIVSDTGEIEWVNGRDENGYLLIDTDKFKAVAGVLNGGRVDTTSFSVQLEGRGAITVVSLDDRPIASSEKLLITTVRSFSNTDQIVKTVSGRKYILDPGKEPALLSSARGEVILKRNNQVEPTVYSVGMHGKVSPPVFNVQKVGADGALLKVHVGETSTPWYVLDFEAVSPGSVGDAQ